MTKDELEVLYEAAQSDGGMPLSELEALYEAAGADDEAAEPGTIEALLGGGSRGLQDAWEGLNQVVRPGLDLFQGPREPSFMEGYNEEAMKGRSEYDASPIGRSTAGKVGRFIGETAPSLAVPGGIAGGLVRRGVTGALSGAATGAAQFVEPGGDRLNNIGTGAAVGAAAPGLFDLLTRGGAKAGQKARQFLSNNPTPEQAQLLARGAAHGVPVHAADLSRSPTMASLENVSNAGLFPGMAGVREGQLQQAQNALEAMTGRAAQRVDDTAFRSVSGAQGTPYEAQATRLMEQIDTLDGSDDWTRIIQTSGNVNLLNRKIQAGKKYDLVRDLSGDAPVPLAKTRKTLRSVLREVKESVVPNSELIRVFEGVSDALKGPRTFEQIRRARSDIRDLHGRYRKGMNTMVGEKGSRQIQRVSGALEQDLDRHLSKSTTHPVLRHAWTDADGYYKTEVVPFKDLALVKILNKEDPDEVFSAFVQTGPEFDRMARFYKALDPKGQEGVRYGFMTRAVEDATDPNTGEFSPLRFFQFTKRYRGAVNALFTEPQVEEVKGVGQLMQHLGRKTSSASNPPTGKQLLPAAVGGAGYATKGTLGAIISSVGVGPVLKSLLTSDVGRRFVLNAARVEPDSAEMGQLVTKISQYLQRAATRGAIVQSTQPETEQ